MVQPTNNMAMVPVTPTRTTQAQDTHQVTRSAFQRHLHNLEQYLLSVEQQQLLQLSEQVRIANHQLEANDQLRAVNEQLRVVNEQNEQLRLKTQNEQDEQLRVANEQLKVKDEQLRVANEQLKVKDEQLKVREKREAKARANASIENDVEKLDLRKENQELKKKLEELSSLKVSKQLGDFRKIKDKDDEIEVKRKRIENLEQLLKVKEDREKALESKKEFAFEGATKKEYEEVLKTTLRSMRLHYFYKDDLKFEEIQLSSSKDANVKPLARFVGNAFAKHVDGLFKKHFLGACEQCSACRARQACLFRKMYHPEKSGKKRKAKTMAPSSAAEETAAAEAMVAMSGSASDTE